MQAFLSFCILLKQHFIFFLEATALLLQMRFLLPKYWGNECVHFGLTVGCHSFTCIWPAVWTVRWRHSTTLHGQTRIRNCLVTVCSVVKRVQGCVCALQTWTTTAKTYLTQPWTSGMDLFERRPQILYLLPWNLKAFMRTNYSRGSL